MAATLLYMAAACGRNGARHDGNRSPTITHQCMVVVCGSCGVWHAPCTDGMRQPVDLPTAMDLKKDNDYRHACYHTCKPKARGYVPRIGGFNDRTATGAQPLKSYWTAIADSTHK